METFTLTLLTFQKSKPGKQKKKQKAITKEKAQGKTAADKRREEAVAHLDALDKVREDLTPLVVQHRGWDTVEGPGQGQMPCSVKSIMVALVAATKCIVCGYINGYGSICRVACKCSISSTALTAGNFQNKVFWQHLNENCIICGKRRITGGVLQWCNCLLKVKVDYEMIGFR